MKFLRWIIGLMLFLVFCTVLLKAALAGEEQSMDLEHVSHELWHSVVPGLGAALGLVITGLLFRRHRRNDK